MNEQEKKLKEEMSRIKQRMEQNSNSLLKDRKELAVAKAEMESARAKFETLSNHLILRYYQDLYADPTSTELPGPGMSTQEYTMLKIQDMVHNTPEYVETRGKFEDAQERFAVLESSCMVLGQEASMLNHQAKMLAALMNYLAGQS